MTDKPVEEFVIKEYPNTTRWLEERRILGVGNLILTNRRLAFLHQVLVTDHHKQALQKLSGKTTSEIMEYALRLHQKNFEIPITAITEVKSKRFATFPMPRFYLEVTYWKEKKKKEGILSFMFTISLLRGFFQLEYTVVKSWVWAIERAVKRAKEGEGSN